MDFKSKYNLYKNVVLEFGRYGNGATAIQIVSQDEEEGTLVTATVNIEDYEFEAMVRNPEYGERVVIVKDYSENEGVEAFLKENKIIDPYPIGKAQVGFEQCNIYLLTDEYLVELHEQLGKRPEITEEQLQAEEEAFWKMIGEL